jgi:hypothetical protein
MLVMLNFDLLASGIAMTTIDDARRAEGQPSKGMAKASTGDTAVELADTFKKKIKARSSLLSSRKFVG